jgi:sporulation protein YabP
MEHNISLSKRNELIITGVKKVKTSNPTNIILQLEQSGLVISGTNLSVEQVDLKEGRFSANGTINQIRYTNKTKSFSFKNIFK